LGFLQVHTPANQERRRNNLNKQALEFVVDLFDLKAQSRRNSKTVLRILRLRIGQKCPKAGMHIVQVISPTFFITKKGLLMIVFDLECHNGHIFEGWFESFDSFREQKERDLVSCPYCEDTDIRKVMSPVALKRSVAENRKSQVSIDYSKLAKEIVDYVHNSFEDVGTGFAAEALKIHYGVSEKRNIRGTATEEDEKTLKEEGIDFAKIPVPKITDNEN